MRFAVSDDRRVFDVPVPQGSAIVRIAFHPWGAKQTIVSLAAEVLIEIDLTASNRLEVLEDLNALNQTSLFGRFFLDADRRTIALQYELLGDELDAEELMNALYTVGVLADQADDELLRTLGTGRRASDVASRMVRSSRGERMTDHSSIFDRRLRRVSHDKDTHFTGPARSDAAPR